MIISKNGIFFGKSLFTWDQFFVVVNLINNDQKQLKKMKNAARNLTEFSSMMFDQNLDFDEISTIATALGLKPTKTLEGTKARIKKYLSTTMDSDNEVIRI